MDNTDQYEQLLNGAGIRPTAIRLMILRTLHSNVKNIFSLQDLSRLLPTVDPSTLFRAITIFAEKQIIHQVDDGSGLQKYCVCHCEDESHHRGHVHLSCIICHQTICLTEQEIPAVTLPEGYELVESEFVVKVICPKCREKKKKNHTYANLL